MVTGLTHAGYAGDPKDVAARGRLTLESKAATDSGDAGAAIAAMACGQDGEQGVEKHTCFEGPHERA